MRLIVPFPDNNCAPWPRNRFNKQRGEDLKNGQYAATVTRLSILWAAICGVVEIVGMLQRRKELLEVSSTHQPRFSSTYSTYRAKKVLNW